MVMVRTYKQQHAVYEAGLRQVRDDLNDFGHEICMLCSNRVDCLADAEPNRLFCIEAWDKWRDVIH